MNESTKEQLENEIHKGEQALKAYHLWVKNYIDTQTNIVIETFKNADSNSYFYIQSAMKALTAMETAIKQDIETGELAKKQLKGD